MIPDEPVFSPKRIWLALRMWAYLTLRDEWMPPLYMVRWHRRPHAEYEKVLGRDG